jgi:hypothetical protein
MMAVELRTVGRLVVRGTRRAALTVAGFALVALGLAGLVLPVLPGWIFIIAGLAVLSREYAWADSGLTYARRKAAQGGAGVRSVAAYCRGRRGRSAGDDTPEPSGFIPSDHLVIDLTYPGVAGAPLQDSEQSA